jgi:glucan phosphoethanolaminetransferase (alkaline phosphatase superfamily)
MRNFVNMVCSLVRFKDPRNQYVLVGCYLIAVFLALLLIYKTPYPFNNIGIAVGILAFIHLTAFVIIHRRTNLSALVTPCLSAFAPYVTVFYLRRHQSPLLNFYDETGAYLVQLAFFFAGLLALIAFVLTRFRNPNIQGLNKQQLVVSVVLVIIVLGIMAFYPEISRPPINIGPPVYGAYAPLNCLALLRTLIGCFGVYLALQPINTSDKTS